MGVLGSFYRGLEVEAEVGMHWAEFQIVGTGTNKKVADNKRKAAKAFNVLKLFQMSSIASYLGKEKNVEK